jgi:hypothetical protein
MSDELVAIGLPNDLDNYEHYKDEPFENNFFDLELNIDIDEAEGFNDYSMYENRTGLAEDMKFLASMPELCDITFLVGTDKSIQIISIFHIISIHVIQIVQILRKFSINSLDALKNMIYFHF